MVNLRGRVLSWSIPVITIALTAAVVMLDVRDTEPLIRSIVESDIREWFVGDRKGLLAVIWEWQTLIAGVAAVNAAYFTIWQMRLSDERADERHSESIGLSLRPTALEVERAAALCGQLKELRDWCSKAASQIRQYKNDRAYREFCTAHSELKAEAEEAKELCGITSLDRVQRLFRGDNFRKTEHMRSMTGSLVQHFQKMEYPVKNLQDIYEKGANNAREGEFQSELAEHMTKAANCLDELNGRLKIILTELDDLTVAYSDYLELPRRWRGTQRNSSGYGSVI